MLVISLRTCHSRQWGQQGMGRNVSQELQAGVQTLLATIKSVSERIAEYMPQDQSGIELAKELKGIKRDVPIILCSGTMPTNRQNVDVYIDKGELTSDFLRIVREVVRRFCY